MLLQELLTYSHRPHFQKITRFGFEVIGLAARWQEPYVSNVKATVTIWLRWITSRPEEPYADQTTALFAELEGAFDAQHYWCRSL